MGKKKRLLKLQKNEQVQKPNAEQQKKLDKLRQKFHKDKKKPTGLPLAKTMNDPTVGTQEDSVKIDVTQQSEALNFDQTTQDGNHTMAEVTAASEEAPANEMANEKASPGKPDGTV